MHIPVLLLVTDNKSSGISRREENGRRNCFMVNLRESMGQGWDETLNYEIEFLKEHCHPAGLFLRLKILLMKKEPDETVKRCKFISLKPLLQRLSLDHDIIFYF